MKKVIIQYLAFGSDNLFVFPLTEEMQNKSDKDILEFVFRQCNHVDRTEFIREENLRSMSVGDIVIILEMGDVDMVWGAPEVKAAAYQCAMMGWKKI